MKICEEQLKPEREKYVRKSLLGEQLGYMDQTPNGVDDKESDRNFLQSIEDFVVQKAEDRANTRKRLGLPDGMEKPKSAKSRKSNKGKLQSFLGRLP